MDGSRYWNPHLDPAPPEGRSAWRWFPWAVAGTMAIVIAVNVWMVVLAMRSFPGAAQGNGFVLSNEYNQVLKDEAKQEALGWTLAIALDAAQRPMLTLTDHAGHALDQASVEASAARPLGPPQTTALGMQAVGAGRYLSQPALARGQWDVTLRVQHGNDVVRAVRRLIVR